MRSAIAVAAALAGLAATPATAPTPYVAQARLAATPARVFNYPAVQETLPNGLRVVLIPYDSPGLVAYYTLVRVGSRNEVEPGHSGFAHLFEHMMFRGTKKHPAAAWDAKLRGSGVNTNAFTWNDQTVYTFVLPTEALATLVELEADRFQNLDYTEDVFKTETKAVLGEYNKSFSNPDEKLEEELLDLAFDKHTYKHTTLGFLDDIKLMPTRHQYGLAFFKRFYRPDNCTIYVVGDFDPRVTLDRIKKHYGAWAGKTEEDNVPVEPPQKKERRKHVEWPSTTKPRLVAGYHAPSLGTDLGAAAVQNVLGPYLFGESSPLYRDLVLQRQLVESIRSQYVDTRDPRLFYYLATLKDEAGLAEVEKAVDAAIAEITAGRIDAKRLGDVKSNLRYAVMMHMETPSRIAESLSLFATPTGDPLAINTLHDRIAGLTGEDLVAFAKAYLVAKNRSVVTLTSKKASPKAPAVLK